MAVIPEVPFSLVATTGCVTVVLASLLAYVLLEVNKNKQQDKAASGSEAKPTTKATSFDPEEFPGGAVSIYFGTQTGTAESFAKDLEREGAERGFFCTVIDLEDLGSLSQLAKRSIFVTATYGEGEAPDNAALFTELLKHETGLEVLLNQDESAKIDSKACQHVQFAVFGLGNIQYDHYNAMGKFFDAALAQAGGTRVTPLGTGDDDDDVEADFEKWKEGHLWPTFMKEFGGRKKMNKKSDTQLKLPDCPLQVVYHSRKTLAQPVYDLPEKEIHSSSRHYFTAVDCPVSVVRELRKGGGAGSTVHVEIDVAQAQVPGTAKKHRLDYTTADNLGVLPLNNASVVERVASALSYDLNALISVQAAANCEWHGAPFPMPSTIRDVLTRYCDLQAPPRRSDLKLLALYCTSNSTDQKALLRMATKEGRAEYKEKILEGYVGLVDLLKLCPSISMPLEHFLHFCAPLQTRFFTISSSNLVHPDSVHLTVAVTDHVRSDGSVFHGVCSNHLAAKKKTVRVFNRPSTFRLPQDASRPIIMIGPGTGVAPMRSFLQERSYLKTKRKVDVGQNILYFGCQKAAVDYIYKEELQAFEREGVLDRLRVAFSREQSEKVYVQHLLKEHAQETWELLSAQTAHVYVCGGVKMGQDVAEALKEIVSTQGAMTMEEAKEYLAKLSREGRFVQELWA